LIAVIAALVFTRCSLDFIGSNMNPMEARFNRVHYGMTVEEVEGSLGKPSFSDLDGQKIWSGQSGVIVVDFESGRVTETKFMPIHESRFPHRLGP
jgi:hypothetical protein